MTVTEEKALGAARGLQRAREQSAAKVDAAAKRFAEAIGNHINVCRGQQVQLRDAGHETLASNMGPIPAQYETALAWAIDEVERHYVNAKLGFFGWRDHIAPSTRKPLSEMDARPMLLTGPVDDEEAE